MDHDDLIHCRENLHVILVHLQVPTTLLHELDSGDDNPHDLVCVSLSWSSTGRTLAAAFGRWLPANQQQNSGNLWFKKRKQNGQMCFHVHALKHSGWTSSLKNFKSRAHS